MFLLLSCSNKSRIFDVNNKTHSIHPNNMDTVCLKLLYLTYQNGFEMLQKQTHGTWAQQKQKMGHFNFESFQKV